MRKAFVIGIVLTCFLLSAETLFQVKDSSDRVVLDVSTDGLRIFNGADTLMVISSSAIKAFIQKDANKALSRAFSVTTSSSTVKGQANVLEVTTGSTSMREGTVGLRYTNFSPENIFLGLKAGLQNFSGVNNIFIGNESGSLNYHGDDNIYIGYQAGYRNDWASENIFIGNYSGYNNYSDDPFPYGSMNVFLGTYSGFSNIDGYLNTFLGYRAGEDNRGARENTYIGGYAGSNNNGSSNVALGVSALNGNTTGVQNTAIGTSSGMQNLTGSRNVFLGYNAGYSETGSDKLYIENSNSSSPLIWGDFSSNLVRINGQVGINTANSSYGLYVVDDFISVFGNTDGTGTYTYGLYGDADGGTTRNVSVYGSGASGAGTNWAGYFAGNVYVSGTVSKSSDEVKIDHPLDPENKFLSHTGVSSDQMSNIYHGNVVLDNEGKATIRIESWIESVNKEFRYQLTSIGAPGPNLYIAREIAGSSFEIAGGVPGSKVSWQVTGIRNDNYAKSNLMRNETEKKHYEKGFYLHPEAYGLTEEAGIEYNIQKRQSENTQNR